MSRETVTKAAGVIPPRVGQTFARAVSTTPASLDLSSYPGYFVTVQADGGSVYVLMGSTQVAAELVDNAAVSGTGQCIEIPDGQERSWVLGDSDNFLGFETAASTAVVRVWVSSERV
jgi:hypothetical protein